MNLCEYVKDEAGNTCDALCRQKYCKTHAVAAYIEKNCEWGKDPEIRARQNEYRRERRKDPEFRARLNERLRERREKDPEYRARQNEQARERNNKDPEIRAQKNERDRERRKGAPPGTIKRLLKAQKGKCDICKTLEHDAPKKRFSLDHCHATGKIRGLLCNHCNAKLGMAKDDPKILRAAAGYLEKHQ